MRNTFAMLVSAALLIPAITGCAPALVVGAATTAVAVAHDRRTAATQLEDQVIEVKAHSAFIQAKEEIGRTRIGVTSYNNVVLLTGEVERPEIKQWAESVAKAIDGVRFVHNDLLVSPPSAWGSRSNDLWIATKAKSSLLKVSDIPGFDPTRVKVVTSRGIVYLFGLLTESEGAAVTNTVRTVGGVQQVVKLFEYLDHGSQTAVFQEPVGSA